AWYCSEPRLAFNRTVVLRYRIHLEQRQYAPATINLRLAAVRRVAYEAADAGLLSARTGCGHPPCDGRSASRRPARELVDARTGPAAVAKPASRHAARTARPCDAGHAHRLRFTPRRVARPHAGVYPAAKGTLGDRRSCREGRSPSRSGSTPRSMRGPWPPPPLPRVVSFVRSTKPGGFGATGCRRRCFG